MGLSEHLPKALAAFLREHPDISVDVEERESTDIAAAIASGAANLGFAAEHALPDNLERFLFSEDRLMLVAAGVGIAVVPEAAARRCARSMSIMMIKIRDPWANRKLAICARSFSILPRPAKQLVEHLRKAAQ